MPNLNTCDDDIKMYNFMKLLDGLLGPDPLSFHKHTSTTTSVSPRASKYTEGQLADYYDYIKDLEADLAGVRMLLGRGRDRPSSLTVAAYQQQKVNELKQQVSDYWDMIQELKDSHATDVSRQAKVHVDTINAQQAEIHRLHNVIADMRRALSVVSSAVCQAQDSLSRAGN